MPISGIQEQLRALDRLELTGGVEVFQAKSDERQCRQKNRIMRSSPGSRTLRRLLCLGPLPVPPPALRWGHISLPGPDEGNTDRSVNEPKGDEGRPYGEAGEERPQHRYQQDPENVLHRLSDARFVRARQVSLKLAANLVTGTGNGVDPSRGNPAFVFRAFTHGATPHETGHPD
jgi:hypothetical protein